MSKTAIFHEMADGRGGDLGATIEIVLSHVEALKRLDAATLVLLQGGNGVYVRESVDDVRREVEAQ
jgi:hypothetical protein